MCTWNAIIEILNKSKNRVTFPQEFKLEDGMIISDDKSVALYLITTLIITIHAL